MHLSFQNEYSSVCDEVFSLPGLEPSSSFEFDSPSKKPSYSLQAIIYSGGKHLTVRFRDQSTHGPQLDNIRSEVDLLEMKVGSQCSRT